MWPQGYYPDAMFDGGYFPKIGANPVPFAVDLCTTSILEAGRTHTIRSFGKSIADLMVGHTIKDC